MKTIVQLMVIYLTLSIQASCGSNGEKQESNTPENTFKKPNPPIETKEIKFKSVVTCPKGTSITYENYGQNFLSSHCTHCHNSNLGESQRGGAPVTVNLESHFLIQTNRAASLAIVRAGANRNDYHAIREPHLTVAVTWMICGAP